MTYLLLLKKPSFQQCSQEIFYPVLRAPELGHTIATFFPREKDFAPAIATDRFFTPNNSISVSSHDEELQRTERSTTIGDLAPSTSHAYVSPRDVYSIPKTEPRKSKGSSKGKTQICTATSVREKIALLQKQRKAKSCPRRKK